MYPVNFSISQNLEQCLLFLLAISFLPRTLAGVYYFGGCGCSPRQGQGLLYFFSGEVRRYSCLFNLFQQIVRRLSSPGTDRNLIELLRVGDRRIENNQFRQNPTTLIGT
ncbi:hypothetical protein QBC37DRAFT_415645 [Rhypophila decipiens]|uniref:Secreted protein n=1 Tax=Rhypophila decipiens TaxID=261697 RepID=A0AAN7BDM5_9PEZI|nr:hypothetical protein QBC37DRAFT_415645 [Rhypophila decipiens]